MSKKKKLTLAEIKSILEYNKAMLTCDMSISRDPEHQDVSPDYYGKDAEDLYYAIVFIEKYLDNSIPIEFIKQLIEKFDCERGNAIKDTFAHILTGLLEFWEFEQEKENETV